MWSLAIRHALVDDFWLADLRNTKCKTDLASQDIVYHTVSFACLIFVVFSFNTKQATVTGLTFDLIHVLLENLIRSVSAVQTLLAGHCIEGDQRMTHCGVSWPSGLVHWTQVLVLSECGFESQPGRSWRLCPWARHFNHNCFVLRMGRKAVGPVCCVMHVKEPRTLIVKEKGLAPVFLDPRLEQPAGWICARYKCDPLRRNETCPPDLTFIDMYTRLTSNSRAFQWYKCYFRSLFHSGIIERWREPSLCGPFRFWISRFGENQH